MKNTSSDHCWFCWRYPAEDAACVSVPMHANVSIRQYGATIRTSWTSARPVRVPRCRRCQAMHDIVDKVVLTVSLVAASAFLIWCLSGLDRGGGALVVMLFTPLLALLLSLALRAVIRIFVPWRIRFERYALQHPAIKEARVAGKLPGSRAAHGFFNTWQLLGTKIR